MKIGAMIFATDQTISIPKLAKELEARNFESLWIPEKTHLPASRKTPWPGGELPEWYKRTADPFLVLAAAASVTKRLRLGTGVAMVPVRDAVITAKEVATLDWLSGGRFEFGVGYGWNVEEFESHGVDIKEASPILRDKVALMSALWQNEIGSYQGKYVSVEPSWSWPKPVQVPRPPILLGSRASEQAFRDIAAIGDGWIPIEGYGKIEGQMPRLYRAFEDAGRDPVNATVSVYSSTGDPEAMDRYLEAGVARVVLSLPPATEDTVLETLDHYSRSLSGHLA